MFFDEFDKVGIGEESSSLNTHVYSLPCHVLGEESSSLNTHVYTWAERFIAGHTAMYTQERFIAELPCACEHLVHLGFFPVHR